MKNNTFLVAAIAGTILLLIESAVADGRLEINQASVNAAGGFPYSINSPGNYVLTSDLIVAGDTTALNITAAGFVSIDLNGFRIQGSAGCGGPDCVAGTGSGIKAAPASVAHAVKGGSIIGFSGDCLALTEKAVIDSVRVGSCGGNGIVVGPASVVRNSSVFLTGKAGMLLAEDTLYSGNHVSQPSQGPGTERAIEGGHPSSGNHCDDMSCTHDGRRRYYLSTTKANGSLAAQVCDAGFHMASLWEILDPTALAYDTTRGRTSQDAGDGPPTDNFGWVRTGKPSSFNGSSPGGASCSGYSSTTGNGTMATLPTDWDWDTTVSGERSRLSTWQTTLIECTTSQDVWCVED